MASITKQALKSVLLMCLFVLLIAQGGFAARLTGTIYDDALMPQKDVRIDINTTPKQYFISKDGSYQMFLPRGHYRIAAKHYESNSLISAAEQEVTIIDNGNYILDIILTPRLDEEEELADLDDISVEEEYFSSPPTTKDFVVFYIGVVVVFAILAGFFYWFFFRKFQEQQQKKELSETLDIPKSLVQSPMPSPDELPQKILEFIGNAGGRTTQKDIRKTFPSSEAKISLVLSELEHSGKIKKFKKGRGNVVLLVQ